jgi:hypothetical protein
MDFERLITFEFLSQICLDCKPDRRVEQVAASARVAKESGILHGLIKWRQKGLMNELIN